MQRLLALIGPSAAGKSTLAHELEQLPGIQIIKTITTRPKRAGENSPNHEFVTAATFASLKNNDQLVEAQHIFGHDYGLTKDALNSSAPYPLIILRTSLLESFMAQYPDTFVIALEAPTLQLIERITERGDAARIAMTRFEEEMRDGRTYASLIVDTSQPLTACIAKIKQAIEQRAN